MLSHYIRNPYLHPERYPYFKENERLADKIKNMKDNVVKRIKLLFEKCDEKIGQGTTECFGCDEIGTKTIEKSYEILNIIYAYIIIYCHIQIAF